MADKRVVVSVKGEDVSGRRRDAHVRLEAGEVYVDVFDSKKKKAADAHLESESFPNTVAGRAEATEFLRGYGIRVQIEAASGRGLRSE